MKYSGLALAGILALNACREESSAQEKGEKPKIEVDSNVVFEPARPLLDLAGEEEARRSMWGADITFSGNGFGGGLFYQRRLTDNLSGVLSLQGNVARNTDELELGYDPYTNRMYVPGKVNRLFMFPLMFGLNYRIFSESLADNFRPFVSAGVGPTFILSTPYSREFFSAFGSAAGYIRPGAFVGVGANFGIGKNSVGANVRYYTIPFGGQGLESVRGNPITDFGGLFLGVSVGLGR